MINGKIKWLWISAWYFTVYLQTMFQNDKMITWCSIYSFFQVSNPGVCFVFTIVVFSIFHRRKMHNDVDKIHARASYKICFEYYPSSHQWHVEWIQKLRKQSHPSGSHSWGSVFSSNPLTQPEVENKNIYKRYLSFVSFYQKTCLATFYLILLYY